MNKNILFTIFIIVISCTTNNYDRNIYNVIINTKYDYPLYFDTNSLNEIFVKSGDNKYTMTKISNIILLYRDNQYGYTSYNNFIKDILNEKKNIDYNDFKNYDSTKEFHLDKELYTLYKKNKIDNLIKEYTFDKNTINSKELKLNLPDDDSKYTIMYCFFKNGYFISFDDVSGYFYAINAKLLE